MRGGAKHNSGSLKQDVCMGTRNYIVTLEMTFNERISVLL